MGIGQVYEVIGHLLIRMRPDHGLYDPLAVNDRQDHLQTGLGLPVLLSNRSYKGIRSLSGFECAGPFGGETDLTIISNNARPSPENSIAHCLEMAERNKTDQFLQR